MGLIYLAIRTSNVLIYFAGRRLLGDGLGGTSRENADAINTKDPKVSPTTIYNETKLNRSNPNQTHPKVCITSGNTIVNIGLKITEGYSRNM